MEEMLERRGGSLMGVGRSGQERRETHCHGRFVRCGETNSQLPLSGLYRRCEISSRIASGIFVEFLASWW
jgi:hypothetical protein